MGGTDGGGRDDDEEEEEEVVDNERGLCMLLSSKGVSSWRGKDSCCVSYDLDVSHRNLFFVI